MDSESESEAVQSNDMDEDDMDDEDWPRLRGEMDEHGRLACDHDTVTHRTGRRACHGCLVEVDGVDECELCRMQLCRECLHNGL